MLQMVYVRAGSTRAAGKISCHLPVSNTKLFVKRCMMYAVFCKDFGTREAFWKNLWRNYESHSESFLLV
jgi:hypothetical protein